MKPDFVSLIWLIVVGGVALDLLVEFLFYELQIHFAYSYLVKINYKADVGVNSTATYAIKALSENDAYIYAIKKFAKVRSVGDITSTNVSKID